MTDYTETIKNNLYCFPGFVKHSERIAAINEDLNKLVEEGFSSLVSNFCNQTDPDRARDFLFEIWICKMLKQSSVENLRYEPPISKQPPDFRCNLEGVQFDIQVKRLHNVINEIAKRIFQRECRHRLSKHAKPWFINLRISDEFQRQYINDFFQFLDKNMHSFAAKADYQGLLAANDYVWEWQGKRMVGFSFSEKNTKTAGISIGAIHSGNPGEGLVQRIDPAPYRSAMNRVLKKSKPTFFERASNTQSNLVMVQPDSELWGLDDADDMADVLYGDDQTVAYTRSDGHEIVRDIRGSNGILKDRKFSNITGVIFVPPSVFYTSEKLSGSYFLSEFHLEEICIHPKLFSEMTYYVLPEWKTHAEK